MEPWHGHPHHPRTTLRRRASHRRFRSVVVTSRWLPEFLHRTARPLVTVMVNEQTDHVNIALAAQRGQEHLIWPVKNAPSKLGLTVLYHHPRPILSSATESEVSNINLHPATVLNSATQKDGFEVCHDPMVIPSSTTQPEESDRYLHPKAIINSATPTEEFEICHAPMAMTDDSATQPKLCDVQLHSTAIVTSNTKMEGFEISSALMALADGSATQSKVSDGYLHPKAIISSNTEMEGFELYNAPMVLADGSDTQSKVSDGYLHPKAIITSNTEMEGFELYNAPMVLTDGSDTQSKVSDGYLHPKAIISANTEMEGFELSNALMALADGSATQSKVFDGYLHPKAIISSATQTEGFEICHAPMAILSSATQPEESDGYLHPKAIISSATQTEGFGINHVSMTMTTTQTEKLRICHAPMAMTDGTATHSKVSDGYLHPKAIISSATQMEKFEIYHNPMANSSSDTESEVSNIHMHPTTILTSATQTEEFKLPFCHTTVLSKAIQTERFELYCHPTAILSSVTQSEEPESHRQPTGIRTVAARSNSQTKILSETAQSGMLTSYIRPTDFFSVAGNSRDQYMHPKSILSSAADTTESGQCQSEESELHRFSTAILHSLAHSREANLYHKQEAASSSVAQSSWFRSETCGPVTVGNLCMSRPSPWFHEDYRQLLQEQIDMRRGLLDKLAALLSISEKMTSSRDWAHKPSTNLQTCSLGIALNYNGTSMSHTQCSMTDRGPTETHTEPTPNRGRVTSNQSETFCSPTVSPLSTLGSASCTLSTAPSRRHGTRYHATVARSQHHSCPSDSHQRVLTPRAFASSSVPTESGDRVAHDYDTLLPFISHPVEKKPTSGEHVSRPRKSCSAFYGQQHATTTQRAGGLKGRSSPCPPFTTRPRDCDVDDGHPLCDGRIHAVVLIRSSSSGANAHCPGSPQTARRNEPGVCVLSTGANKGHAR